MSAHVDTFVGDNLPPRELWPEMTFTLPELQFPVTYNAGSILDRAIANGHGARNAVLFSSATITYDALLEEACRIGYVLTHDFGLVPGNRVLVHASNSRLSIAVWWGILRAGGIAVGTMPMLRPQELAVILNKAQVSHAIVDAHRASEIEQARLDAPSLKHIVSTDELEQRMASAPASFVAIPTAADDPALIAFTSGTTGAPKGCIHFHRDIAAMAETFSRHVLQPKSVDVFVGTPPLAFTFGLGAGVIFPASVGAATVICAKPGFDVLADAIAQHTATTLFTSPTGYRALMKQDLSKLVSLRTCVSAGEHLPRATSDQWFERTGIRIIDGIGSTEMIHIFVSARGDDIRPGATGKAVPGYEATLLDANDQPFDREGQGRLAIRGPTGCRYLADERQRNYVVNGWNVTGDIYRRDGDGYFWYVSRADDMIISSGYNIGAPEVENALLTHDAVAECAVVGAPDEERGAIVKAFVVLKAGMEASDATVRALQDHVKQTIAPYKYPRSIAFVAELPKTHTGKVQRFKLRERNAMKIFSRNTVVRFEHCDAAGIMFYPRFFGLVNETVEDWFASLGHTFATLHVEERKGVPTVRLESEFIAPVRMGQILSQSLGVDEIGRSSCHLKHLAAVGDVIVARFDQTIVYADLATMKAEPWPPDLRKAMTDFAGVAE